MRRVLFSWRGIRVWSHPALLYAGLVIGVLGQQAAAKTAGLDAAASYIAVLLLIPAALAGNRLLWLALHPGAYRADRGRAWRRSEGGGVMYGGLPAVLLVSIPLLAALGLPFWRFWDVMPFCILPAMIVARLGCLLNGCCHGRPSTSALALHLPDASGTWTRRHPTQLLEAVAATLILIGAVLIGPARQAPGTLFLAVAASYAVARLALQPLREHAVKLRGVDVSSAISGALLVSSCVGLTLLR